MPVADTTPHPMTVREDGHKPSCFNRRPFEKELMVQRGWLPFQWTDQFVKHTTKIPHTMTTECQIAKDQLPECAGCKHIGSKV